MAEPAIGGNTPISFNTATNGNQLIDLSEAIPFPVTIPTNDTNINVVSAPPISNLAPSELTTRQVENADGIIQPVRVSNLKLDGSITLYGRYPQNSVDIEKYDLSSINVIYDADVNFNFILSLKDGENSVPQLYTSKNFYNELISNYATENPFPVNRALNPSQIVVVDILPIKQKIEDLRTAELNLDINLTNVSDKNYVVVSKHIFANSNYETDSVSGFKATPTYNVTELLKYISWVVSKPPQNYNNRVLPADSIGEWRGGVSTTPSNNEPSTQLNNDVDENNNPTTTTTPLYPPIGRAGSYDEDEAYLDGALYLWDAAAEEWVETNRDDIPGGGS